MILKVSIAKLEFKFLDGKNKIVLLWKSSFPQCRSHMAYLGNANDAEELNQTNKHVAFTISRRWHHHVVVFVCPVQDKVNLKVGVEGISLMFWDLAFPIIFTVDVHASASVHWLCLRKALNCVSQVVWIEHCENARGGYSRALCSWTWVLLSPHTVAGHLNSRHSFVTALETLSIVVYVLTWTTWTQSLKYLRSGPYKKCWPILI